MRGLLCGSMTYHFMEDEASTSDLACSQSGLLDDLKFISFGGNAEASYERPGGSISGFSQAHQGSSYANGILIGAGN